MKKKIKLLLTTILIVSMVGCASKSDNNTTTTTTTPTVEETPTQIIIEEVEETSEPTTILATEDFAYMGLMRFEENVDSGKIYVNPYNLLVEYNADIIVEKLGNNDINFATLPLSVALDIYNSDEFEYDIQTLAILNTGGVYLVENGNSVKTMDDLANNTIYALGKYSSYEKELRYILTKNGVDVDSIEFEYIESYDDVFEIEDAIVVMAQPFVCYYTESHNANICLDLENEWNKIVEKEEIPAPFITSVIVSNTDFIDTKTNMVREFLMYANMSVNALNIGIENGNNILEEYDIPKEAIETTNITYIAGEDMAFFIGAYAFALEEYIEEFPDDDFYFWE